MFSNIKLWLDCSRWYTLPMSFFSWLVIFIYALKQGGNLVNGIVALIGICSAHLATNLFDDFCDFKSLNKKIVEGKIELPNTQRGKCRYIINGTVSLSDVLRVVCLYCTISLFIGLFLCYSVGLKTLLFIAAGGLIVLFYSFLSNHRLSEFAVGVAFGPVLFGGVYYVMTGQININPFLLAVPVSIFTINLLFTDTCLDIDIDKKEGKKTLAEFLGENALFFQIFLLTIGYISLLVLPAVKITHWGILSVYLTIPLSIDLIKSLQMYSQKPDIIPKRKWYHFPFEDWDDITENRSQSFMFRMYQARNLMIYVSLLLCIAIL